jgi:hypothetical protein
MVNVAFQRDVGAYLKASNALNPATFTTTNDDAEQTGTNIDREAFSNHPALSCKVIIPYNASLAATETLTVVSNFQHSSASSAGWADFDDKDGSTQNSVVTTTGTTAATTPAAVLTYDVDLSSAKRWVRIQITPTLSAASADTCGIAGTIVFGGENTLPAA